MKIAAIILASGFSKRMGNDKLFLKVNDKEMYKIIIDKVSKIDFQKKIIVTNNNWIKKYAENYNFTVIENKNAILGKAESIKCGVREVINEEACMIFVADQPFLKIKTINRLIDLYYKNKNYIVYPTILGEKNTPTIIPNKYFNDLLRLEAEQGGAYISNDNISKKLFLDNKYELTDIDTVDGYKNIKKLK